MLKITHIELSDANAFVAEHHRHHKPVTGHRFSIGVCNGGKLVGVAIVGRPVARKIDQRSTVEVLRLCTDGTRNACSILYAACRRAARELGYSRIITYILDTESGASLRAAGWIRDPILHGGGNWNVPSRPRENSQNVGRKQLYYSDL